MKKFYFLLFLLMVCCNTFAQTFAQNTTSRNSTWIANSESPKAFIENKGQFAHSSCTDIKFAVDEGHTLIYFTPNGLTYYFRKKENGKKDEEEMEREAKKKKNMTAEEWIEFEREEKRVKIETDVVSMQWENANPDAKIIAEEKAEGYRSYSFYEGKEVKNINHINGFKKIIYKNIYPNIDVEYIFHSKGGIKYSLLLHPGADASQVKMKYSNAKKVSLDTQGEIHITTKFGDIIDHTPLSFYQYADDASIGSSFKIKNNTVTFELEKYDHSNTIIIDPWVQTPTLPNSNGVWECEKDANGNVYIIGGDMPMVLQKYNSAGVFQWTYNTPYDTTNNWLGTFATDLAGNSYVTSGSTAAMQKIDNNAGMIWSVTGGSLDEYWSIAFNCDQTKLIVGGTRLGASSNPFGNGGSLVSGNGVIFDINTSNGNVTATKFVTSTRNYSYFGLPVSDVEEVRSISSSKNAKYYFLTLDTIGAIDQNFSACPNGNLFAINHGYNWAYKCEDYRPQNGNSGICAIKANGNFVYTQNGATLHKRSLVTGAILATASIPGGIYNSTTFFGLTTNQSGNSGIDIDSCGNVYVGSGNGVYKYDANLNLITSSSTAFSVFDVAVSYNGNVIVCGTTGTSSSASRTGYVQSFNLSACPPMVLFCCDAGVCPAGPFCTTDAPVTLTPSGTSGTWSGPGITNASAGTFDPSVSGAGTFMIANTLGCGSDSVSITVNACAALSVCQESNGNLTVSSGTAPYTWQAWTPPSSTPITTQAQCTACNNSYTWFGGTCLNGFTPVSSCNSPGGWTTFATGTTVTPPANDTLRVTDNFGNTLEITDTSLLAPCSPCTPPTTTMSSATTSCGLNNGTATATPSGGTSPYTYNWSNGATSASLSGLAAGSYSVTVTGGGCTVTSSVTVSSSTGVTSTTSSTSANCGSNNGTATVTPSGGTTPYTYAWSNGSTSATLSGLAAGNYSVTVTSANNCTNTNSVTVSSSSGMTATSSANNTSCGNNNGTATATPNGGTSPYTYLWSNSQTTQTITGLASGTYSVTITDNSGCTVNASSTVNTSTGVTASATATNTSCGSNNGTATASQTGGNSPYTYLWNTGVQTQNLASLPAGNYIVTITDNSGCTDTASTTVISSSGLNATTSSTIASCGSSNGTATVTPSGGTSPYTYLWSNGSTTLTASGLAAATYSVTVTDNSNCTFITSATVSTSGGPTATASATSATCNGASTGTATAAPTGGTTPYTYLWNNSQTTITATGLASGNYTVTITDAGGCTTTASAVVSQPTAIAGTTTSVDATCGQADGSATVNASGGNSPYTYLWSNGSISATLSGLAAGSYPVTITDANNCTQTTTATVSNANAPSANINSVPPSCHNGNNGTATVTANGGSSPYTYLWNDSAATAAATATGLFAGIYFVTVTDNAGCKAITSDTINNPAPVTVLINASTDTVCTGSSSTLTASSGSTYQWSTGDTTKSIVVTPSADSTFVVTVTDANGCTGDTSFSISLISSSVSVSGPTVVCKGASATLTASNGSAYHWSTGDTTKSITVSPLSATTYYDTVTTACGKLYDSITVNISPVITAYAGKDTTIRYGTDAQLLASGGTVYHWQPPASLSCEYCPNPVASPAETTTYIVTVYDSAGCTAEDTVIVTVDDSQHYISVPNIFSPNGDGNNDFIKVHGYGIKELKFIIYDRWGEKVFETSDITLQMTWDGTFRGKPLNSAVFVYILDAAFGDNTTFHEKGNITLIR